MRESAALTKITRPRLSGIIPRERLFRLLDEGGLKPVTWLSAPGGSGKTSLAASWLDSRKLSSIWYQVDIGDGDLASFFFYLGMAVKKAAPRCRQPLPFLTPEYFRNIPVFTRRFFEKLFTRLSDRSVIVLDNYQDAPKDSGFDEMVAHALETVPEGMRVLVLSRNDPPPQLVKLRANNRLLLLGWEEVRFSLKESAALLSAGRQARKDKTSIALLHEKTEGWAAGLVLMKESMDRSGVMERAPAAHEHIFSYFAGEIFDKTDKTTQEVLLRSAFLARIEPSMAERLTGIGSAGQILERLRRQHYFTQKHEQGYQYHPLFREFLAARAANTFNAAELAALRRRAAELMAEAACMEEAIGLFADAHAWDRLCELVPEHAPKLFAEGRSKTIEAWLRIIPAELFRKTPWALYWMGMCRLPFDPLDARARCETAYRLFGESGDVAGQYLAWSGIADSFIFLWDDFSGMKHWLKELERLHRKQPVFPSPQIEARVILSAFTTLYYVDPNNSLVEPWRRRIEELLYELPDVNIKCQMANSLSLYYVWYGTVADEGRIAQYVAQFRDHGAASPFSRILVRMGLATPSLLSGKSSSAERFCEEGLRIAEQSGVHMLDMFLLAYQVYARGYYFENIPGMEPLLERMGACVLPLRRLDAVHYHTQMAWYLSLRNRYEEALIHCREGSVAARLSVGVGTAFVATTTAQVHILEGRLDEAEACLHQTAAAIGSRGYAVARYQSGMVRAALALRRGREDACARELRKTLALARSLGRRNYIYSHPAILQAVCTFALRVGIETDFVVSMIQQCRLAPPDDAPENWPYPVRIFTRGSFKIVVNDKPVAYSRKLQKRPLELLKALIELGGRDIPEERISDLLWPDAEGDKAHQSFATTLKRLRKLLCDKNAILLKGGCLTLNQQCCWVDVLSQR